MSVFYDLASLVLVPSGYKAEKVYAQKPLTTDGQLAFSRASTATRVNASGLIETVASNVPRLDYLGATCGPRLNLEPQRTNLLTYSEAFNVGWTATESTVTTDVTAGPNGVSSADKITASTNNSLHLISKSITDTAAPWTYSVFAKAAGHDRIILNAYNTNYVGFNLTSGVVESSLGIGITSASIQNYGNGWYRCSITSASVSSGISVALTVFNAAYTNGNTNPIFTGNETDGVFIWGAQFEAGVYPSSYIPTEATAVTRLADAASKTGISSLIGQTAGTIYAEWTANNVAQSGRIIAIGDGSFDNRIVVLEDGNSVRVFIATSNGVQADLSNLSNYVGTHKIAVAYANNDLKVYIDGVAVATYTTFSVPPCSVLYIGTFEDGTGTVPLGGGIAQALLFKTRLNNAQLAELTSL